MTEMVAILACAILFGLAVFQSLLIAGYPLGNFAWGGTHLVLPYKLRVASAISIILYLLFGLFILEKAGIVDVLRLEYLIDKGMWVLTAYFFIGIFMNAISRSRQERMAMTPVAVLLSLLFLYVTLST